MLSNDIKTQGLQSAYEDYMEKIFATYIDALIGGESDADLKFKKALDLGTKAMETAQQLLGL